MQHSSPDGQLVHPSAPHCCNGIGGADAANDGVPTSVEDGVVATALSGSHCVMPNTSIALMPPQFDDPWLEPEPEQGTVHLVDFGTVYGPSEWSQ